MYPDAIDTAESLPILLLAEDLVRHRRNGDRAVNHVSLELKQGDIVALLGLNGAGKTTTLKMLSGVLTPHQGRISVCGFSLASESLQAKQCIGFLPDNPPLYSDMRVDEVLTLAGQIYGLRSAQLLQQKAKMMERCQLTSVKHKLVSSLSKGFKQRVGLAQALIHQPAVLLLDEPSNGLDPQQLETLRQIILEASNTAAIVLSTHLLSEARAICNRVAIMHQGELVTHQPVDDESLTKLFQSVTQ